MFNPYGIATDASGALYVADTGNRRVLRITDAGVASALATPGFVFSAPTGVTLAANGDIVVADNNLGLTRILRASPSSTLSFNTATPVGKLDTTDGTKTISLQNIGNAALTFTLPAASATNPTLTSTAFQLVSSSSTCPLLTSSSTVAGSLPAGAGCNYAISFTPTAVGANAGALVIADRSSGAATGTSQSFALAGTGLANLDTLNIFTTVSNDDHRHARWLHHLGLRGRHDLHCLPRHGDPLLHRCVSPYS